MFLESIEYTATLIEYVARQVGLPISNVASILGKTKIFNLCHNAPMNRLLPIEKIAKEVVFDNYLPCNNWVYSLVVHYEYGSRIAKKVGTVTDDKYEYVDELYNLLISDNGD